MNVVIVDEALKNRSGHWFEYDLATKRILEESGQHTVQVLGHVDMEDSVRDELDASRCFRFTSWDGIYDSNFALNRYLGILRHNFRLHQDMRKFLLNQQNVELVFAPTVVLYHLIAFYFLSLFSPDTRFVLMIRNSIAIYSRTGERSYRTTSMLWRVMFRLMESRVRAGSVRFVTDSEALQEELLELGLHECHVLAHPTFVDSSEIIDSAQVQTGKKFRLFLPGPARYEKGVDLLLEALGMLELGQPIEVVLQWPEPFALPDGTEMGPTGVSIPGTSFVVHRDPLSSEAYQEELEQADLILLPYRVEAYYARISGVAVEALRMGKPVLYTRNTWTARLMEKFECGLAVDESASSIAQGIGIAIAEIARLNAQAIEAASKSNDYFSDANFLEALGVAEETPSIVYYLPVGEGGIQRYGLAQAEALSSQGFEVSLLGYSGARLMVPEGVRFYDLHEPVRGYRVARLLSGAFCAVLNAMHLRKMIRRHRPNYVLFGSFFEYWAPLWFWLLEASSKRVAFGAVVHDPIRDYIAGPDVWHRWSLELGYSLFRDLFVHSEIKSLEGTTTLPKVLPHGIYEYPDPERDRTTIRQYLEIPEQAYLLLSFGHIRDSKNIELVVQALRELKDVYLLVVGREQGAQERSVEFYRSIAERLGVGARCRFVHRFVEDDEVNEYFVASDCLLLTYSGEFRSASGVLNSNATVRLPVLASGGEGPLKDAMEAYDLGLWVDADSSTAIVEGVNRLRVSRAPTGWEEFVMDNSWQKNAEVVIEAIKNPMGQSR